MNDDNVSQKDLKTEFRKKEKNQKQDGEKKWLTWRPPFWATEGNQFSFEEREICKMFDRDHICSSCCNNTRKHANEHFKKRRIEFSKASEILEIYMQSRNHKRDKTWFDPSLREELKHCELKISKENIPRSIYVPGFEDPDENLLHQSYEAIRSLLPEGDCEDFEVVKIAEKYYQYWRPKKVKVILLAESHVYTDKERVCCGPGLDPILQKHIDYNGPKNHLSLVYCLTYGENEAMELQQETSNKNSQPNTGSSQFWSLLAACSRGVNQNDCHVTNKAHHKYKYKFSADLFKNGGLSCKERLAAKLKILNDLKGRGIWLIDTSIVGWYIPQEQIYRRSKVTNDVHKLTKQRPPKNYKVPALALSWETYTKHVVRKAVLEKNLKLIIPIGMEIAKVITCERLKEVVKTDNGSTVKVVDPFPAPNAWIPGGYRYFYEKIAYVVNKAAPPIYKHPSIFLQTKPLV